MGEKEFITEVKNAIKEYQEEVRSLIVKKLTDSLFKDYPNNMKVENMKKIKNPYLLGGRTYVFNHYKKIRISFDSIIFGYYSYEIHKKDDEFYIDCDNEVYFKYLEYLLDKLEQYSKINTRQGMLEFCNTHGMYIDENYYDLNSISDCAQYIVDCNNNYYCDKFMYNIDVVPLCEYDEDYYPTYYYEKVGREKFNDESLWVELIKRGFDCNSLDVLEFSDFIEHEALLALLYKFNNTEVVDLLGNFLINADSDNWWIDLNGRYERMDYEEKEILNEEIKQYINITRFEKELLAEIPINKTESKIVKF